MVGIKRNIDLPPLRLSPRLECLLSLLPPAAGRLIDIGCDHALLPIAALERGMVGSALAVDVRSRPLDRARANILARGLEQGIGTVLSDGFDEIDLQPGDAAIIAGIGAAVIVDILRRARKSGKFFPGFFLLLQPTRSTAALRMYLAPEWETVAEKFFFQGGRLYNFISAIYRGRSKEISIIHNDNITKLPVVSADIYEYIAKRKASPASLYTAWMGECNLRDREIASDQWRRYLQHQLSAAGEFMLGAPSEQQEIWRELCRILEGEVKKHG
ncbi:MAG: SAM-dependent methyltransferase [Clostridiaceae bacterium]|nr:SAM-dependent methyltransferase [Clostridiaceae bacterium]